MQMTTKWRVGEDALDDTNIYDTLENAMRAQEWEQNEDGLWYQAGDEEGCTQVEVQRIEEIHPVHQFKIGSVGRVRVEYETTVWAKDQDDALKAADQLPEMLSGSQYEMTSPPDAEDFDSWAKAVTP